jgi:chromobox protein 1
MARRGRPPAKKRLALSDEEISDYETAQPVKSPRKSNSISSDANDALALPRRNGRPSRKEEKGSADVEVSVYAEVDAEDDEEDDEEELDDDVYVGLVSYKTVMALTTIHRFIVEAIKKHMIDEDVWQIYSPRPIYPLGTTDAA